MLVTVILPIRNEAPFIEEVLRAVLAQDYPRDLLEVIVADGQSDDGTRGIVEALAAQDNRLKLIENPQRITTAGLNLAIRAARGEVIVRVDGHGVIPSNYLSECVAWLLRLETLQAEGQEAARRGFDRGIPESAMPPANARTSHHSSSAIPSPRRGEGQGEVPPIGSASSAVPQDVSQPPSELRPLTSDLCLPSSTSSFSPLTSHFSSRPSPLVVGGAWDCVGHGLMGGLIARAVSSPFGVGNAQYRTCQTVAATMETDSVPFWVLRREVFKQIGLFREEMLCHEDYELNHRLRRAGGRIFLLPWLRSKYYVRSSLAGLARQYWRYGVWKGRFLRSHPESLRLRHLAPPFLVAAFTFTFLATLAPIGGRGWGGGEHLVRMVGPRSLAVLSGAYLIYLFFATVVLTCSRSRERNFADCPPSESAICHPQSTIGEYSPRPATGFSPPAASPSSAFNVRCSVFLGSSPRSSFRASFCFLLSSILLLPLILSTLHFCWGTGVWLGLMRGPVPGQPPKL